MKKDLQNVKKNKRGRYLLPLILIVLIIFVSAFILIAHKPGNYAPTQPANPNEVSRYLTNEVLPEIYNGAQLGKDFEVEITQEGLNDIVSHLPQPMKMSNISLAGPQAVITPMQITLMATVEARPIDLFLTIELNPFLNKEGLLNLCVNHIRLGSVDITSIARSAGEKAYSNWMTETGTEPNNIASQICLSLLRDEPFEPVFKMGGKNCRISKVDVMRGKIVFLMSVVPEQPRRATQSP
jgi:uncharacterized protein YpmS